MKRPFFFIATALLITAIGVRADTDIPIDTAKSIKTYTLHKYVSEMPSLNEGDIIKIEFTYRGMQWKENEGDFINTHVFGGDRSDNARVRVPNSARTWFMKIPDHHFKHGHNYFVFARVVNEDNNNKRLELLGNNLETGFAKAVIKWAGQE